MSYEKLVYIQIVIFTDEFLAKFDSIRKSYNLKHCLIALKKNVHERPKPYLKVSIALHTSFL